MSATWRRLDRQVRVIAAVAAVSLLVTFGLSCAWAAFGGSPVPAGFTALSFAAFLESFRCYANNNLDTALGYAVAALVADVLGIIAMLPALSPYL